MINVKKKTIAFILLLIFFLSILPVAMYAYLPLAIYFYKYGESNTATVSEFHCQLSYLINVINDSYSDNSQYLPNDYYKRIERREGLLCGPQVNAAEDVLVNAWGNEINVVILSEHIVEIMTLDGKGKNVDIRLEYGTVKSYRY